MPAVEERRVAPNDMARSSASTDERLTTLRAYRRARGLCYLCGEKWSREHKCATAVQLHVVQELFDMLGISGFDAASEASDSASECHTISKAALDGTVAPQTVRLHGSIQGQKVLMLIDSGSSHSFVSDTLAARLDGAVAAKHPLRGRIADGGQLCCAQEVSNCDWWVQGHKFCSTLKVLPLGCYDMIVGMDWLEKHSPMDVHWGRKQLQFLHHGRKVHLVGVQPNVQQCYQLSSAQFHALLDCNDMHQVIQLCAVEAPAEGDGIPDSVSLLLQQFAHLFEPPTGLPPHRAFDHTIPLIPGAQPVNLRPYRYTPTQKDEIERQVAEMIKQGIIQHSCSPYAAPVLLVQKKDLTWRFCIDFQRLNAITIKNRYPLPIIEELLDELSGSVWFTTLDLCSGFHQIRMKPGEEFKTAFKTHHGHYEFKVMPNGVTGGPSTFQGTMNIVLSPLLRKGVLVFIDDILVHSSTLEQHCELLRQVFQLLAKHQFYLKMSKCKFAQPRLTYLGHVISAAGVSTDDKNIAAVKDWPTPTNAREVRWFLGLAGYYRRFVRNFGIISRSLTNLLKKGAVFVRSEEAESV